MSKGRRKIKLILKLCFVIVVCSVFLMLTRVVDAAKMRAFVSQQVTTLVHPVIATLTSPPKAETPKSTHTPPPLANIHTGRVSFNFQNISVRALLQLIAQQTGQNFIISDGVKGSVGFSLTNVTWKEALVAIMRSQNLDSRRYGNVLMIAPVDELAAQDAKRLQAERQLLNLSPEVSELIPLHYANAKNLAKVLKSQQSNFLSPGGELGVDPRTNSIWIRDSEASLSKAKQFIRELDVPAKQVMIEARIVSIDKKYAEEMGVKWGVSNPSHLSGTLAGANAMQTGTSLANVPLDQRLNFNLPATSAGVFGATPASAGLALLKLGNTYLDLELSALEGEQHADIISNPKIITSNLQKAYIQTGEEIPYQESTSSGATNISFKNAVLSLEITPQITKDNNVVLSLKVTQNKRGSSVSTGSGGVIPAIDTEALLSHVQLRSGQTVVIGGVYKETKNHNVERIPFLGKLPIIGGLFRHKHTDIDHSELLIFITPKVVDQDTITDMTHNESHLNMLSLEVDRGFREYHKKIKLPAPKQVSEKHAG